MKIESDKKKVSKVYSVTDRTTNCEKLTTTTNLE